MIILCLNAVWTVHTTILVTLLQLSIWMYRSKASDKNISQLSNPYNAAHHARWAALYGLREPQLPSSRVSNINLIHTRLVYCIRGYIHAIIFYFGVHASYSAFHTVSMLMFSSTKRLETAYRLYIIIIKKIFNSHCKSEEHKNTIPTERMKKEIYESIDCIHAQSQNLTCLSTI